MMWTLLGLLAVGAQHVHAVAITPSNSTASTITTQSESTTITAAPSFDESGIVVNTCSYINTTDGETLWNSPYCSMYAGTVDLIFWPTNGNHSYPSTFVDTETDYTFHSPSVYMIVNTLYGWNECGPLGPSTSRAIFGFDLDQVSTLVPYMDSEDATTRRSTRQLYLSDLGIDCDGNYNRTHLATQTAPVKDDDTRCNPFLAVPIEAKRWGYPYWKHCGIKNNKFGLFDPPYAVKPIDNLIPITATTADSDPKTTAASTKATAAPEPGPTKVEPSNPEPTKEAPEEEEEEEKPEPGKTEAESEKPTVGGNGDGEGGKTIEGPGSEPEKTNPASPNTPSKDSEAGEEGSQPGSEGENTNPTSPSTPSQNSNAGAGQGGAQPGSEEENTNGGSGSTPSENSGAAAGQDGSSSGSENTNPGSAGTPSEGSNADAGQGGQQSGSEGSEEEDTKGASGSDPSNDSDAGAGQDDSEGADSSQAAPGSEGSSSGDGSSSGNSQNDSDSQGGYAEIDPTEYSGRVVSTMTGEQIVRLGTAGLEIVDVEAGKTSTYAVPAAGVTDDQTTYAPATVAVYSGTTLTLGGPEITVTGAVVVVPHGSEPTGVTEPTLAVVGSSSGTKITASFLGLGVSVLLVLWV